MPRTFLPPPAPDKGFVLPQNQSKDFVGGSNSLLENIHDNMAVRAANSEGRAPSPFARVWQFRRDLAGESGPQEQARAVAAFRGLLALFALRDYYHLHLTADVTPSLGRDAKKAETPISKFFEVHASYLPQPPLPAQARFLYGQRLVFFRLTEPAGLPATVVAGYSPLTLVYPAARRLSHSRALNAVFWYDPVSGYWHDPLNPPEHIQPRLSQDACSFLAAWLDAQLSQRAADGQRLQILDNDGLAAADDQFLSQLFTDWRSDLPPGGTTAEASKSAPLEKSDELLNVEKTQGNNKFRVPAILEKTYNGTARPSDSPFIKDTLILTLEQAGNPAHLIYGNVFGSEETAHRLAGKPPMGDDLGEALERPGEAPVRYVILDGLFTPQLGRLRQENNTINPLWTALTMLDKSKLRGIFLIPFDPVILQFFSAQEVKQSIQAENNIAAIQVTFRHRATGLSVSRNYNYDDDPRRSEIATLDPSMDLRFFPNFRLDLLADPDLQLPFPEDRYYYARLCLSEELERQSLNWLTADGLFLSETPEIIGSFERPDRDHLAPGRRAFWRLPMEYTPGGFNVGGFGFVLLTLRGSSLSGRSAAPAVPDGDQPVNRAKPAAWTVALDFGTTNSCVALDKGAGDVEPVHELTVFTTTLLGKWESKLRGESDEGYSALADFMFWQNAETTKLNRHKFFPTQILTRHSPSIDELPHPGGFDARNGLVFFPNVSLVAMDLEEFPDLLEGFEKMRTDSGIQARFKLKRNLKWKERGMDKEKSMIWRAAFHQHLRLHLILEAANENAYVKQLIVSYPKAFVPDEVKKYRDALALIWGSPNGNRSDAKTKTSETTIEARSESAAAAVALKITRGQEFFLLDMGGGTTDVAVFKDNVLEEECSLTLAGQVLERYVCQSENLRAQIAKCFDEPMKKWQVAFTKPGQSDQVYQTLFQGFLLRRGGTSVLSALRTDAKNDPATQGFLLSAIFLYMGLSYFCGLWLAKRRLGGKGITPEERLQWLGNGSAFIQMFAVNDESFEQVLVQMFNSACNGSAKVSKMREDGKTVVAKGLLKPPAIEPTKGGQKVFSDLLSDSVTSQDQPWTADATMADFYRQFTGAGVSWDGLSEGKVFRGYLEALQKELPKMKFNMSLMVNVDALGVKDPANWAVAYVSQHRAALETKLVQRLKENKYEWNDVLNTGSTDELYVEPLFVSELAALLELVRESHA